MPNHNTRSANIVVNGTAPEDFWPQMKRFSTKNTEKKSPGKSTAVRPVVSFQSSPSNNLQKRDDV
jgi:hypothetical protein